MGNGISARKLTKEERRQVAVNALGIVGKVVLFVVAFPFVLLYYVMKAAK